MKSSFKGTEEPTSIASYSQNLICVLNIAYTTVASTDPMFMCCIILICTGICSYVCECCHSYFKQFTSNSISMMRYFSRNYGITPTFGTGHNG